MKNKPTIIAAVIVFTIAVFALGFMSKSVYDNNQEEKAMAAGQTFINSVMAGDVDAAYEQTSAELKEGLTMEAFTETVGDLKNEDPAPLDPSILTGNGRTVYVQYIDGFEPVGEGNTGAEFFLTMEKDGTDWTVASISIN